MVLIFLGSMINKTSMIRIHKSHIKTNQKTWGLWVLMIYVIKYLNGILVSTAVTIALMGWDGMKWVRWQSLRRKTDIQINLGRSLLTDPIL